MTGRGGPVCVTGMDGFIDDGTGSPEGDRWLDSMLRLCMTVTARTGSGGRHRISVSRREDREGLSSSTLRVLTRGMYDGTLIDPVIRSRIISMSAGTDRAVEGGALIDFPRTADRRLLSDLADIYDTVSDRIMGFDTRDKATDHLYALSRRHLLGPVLLCRDDWTDPGRFLSECATGYLPVSLICPDAENHGYEGPIVDGSWLRMLATVHDEGLHLYLGTDGFGSLYDPAPFAGCSLYAAHPDSDEYEGTFGMDWYLICMKQLLLMQMSAPNPGRLWMVPMTARTVDTLRKRTTGPHRQDAMHIMGGIRMEDIFHAVSGQLRPAESEWLLCDVDWNVRPSPMEVMSVLTGMDGSLDPGSWHRISWAPLADAIRRRDARAAVTAMHAFRMAFSGVFPRTMVSMTGRDGADRLALAATIPDPSSAAMIGGMLQGDLPERFVGEDVDASCHMALLVLPHIEGSATTMADDDDCDYFGIPAIPEADDGRGSETVRLALADKGVDVVSALALHI